MKRRDLLLTTAGAAGMAILPQAAPSAAEGAAAGAVAAARQFRGTTLNVLYEAGLQPLDPKNFTGPMWEELTGIKINVIESPIDQLFTKIMAEHRGRTGAYDVLNVFPAQMPDLALAGALEPLDPFIDKYGYRGELADIAPVYRENQMTVEGKVYGLPDDGDVLILYYRKDIFEDEATRSAFKAKHGYELAAPVTWQQFAEIGQFITDRMAPEVYGAAFIRQPGNAQFMFQERFRVEGGKFFDPETMKATVNSDIGVKVLTEMRADNKFMPPGVEQFGFVEVLSAFLAGNAAMIISWPPVGRWAAGYGRSKSEALAWLPESKVAGKVGYALTPGGHPELAGGFSLCVATGSRQKEAAYLFSQWMNSKEISLQRVQLPYALRDPFRTTHYENKDYAELWPDAPAYLATLQEAANTGLLDLSLLQTDRYEEGIRQALSKLWGGQEPKAIADALAADWDQLTQRIGVDRQKSVYADWAKKPNAYPA